MQTMLAAVIVPDRGERFLVSATSRDVYQWEKAGKGRSMQQIVDRRFDAMYALLHIAAVRQGLYSGSLEEFTGSCDLDFDVSTPEDEEDEGSVPTSGGASGSV